MRVVGTAGHVDHGKSTLVRALTGIDPDRLKEEKAREMTIDLGFAHFTLPNGQVISLIDVPGHRDFIENMLAGVGGIDAVLFVVAADEGLMPQTREHLAIINLLHIPAGVVALTKTDLVSDPDWLDLVQLELAAAFQGTVLEAAPLIPVSARTSSGLDTLQVALGGALEKVPTRIDHGQPRLSVDRVFTVSGFGTVVTGTLIDGPLCVGQEIELQPSGLRARIRGLQVHGDSVDCAEPGSRAAINLAGVDRQQIKRGHLLSLPGEITPTTLIDVAFEHLPGASRPLSHNAEVKVFCGAAESMARVRLLDAEILAPGTDGWLQLQLAEPLPLVKGDRFIVRYPSPGETFGGGTVIDPAPGKRWRRFRPEVTARFELFARGDPADLMRGVLEFADKPLTLAQIAEILALDPAQLDAHLLTDCVMLPDGYFMSRTAWDRRVQSVIRTLDGFHKAEPLRMGMTAEALRSRLAFDDPQAFRAFVAACSERGLMTLTRNGEVARARSNDPLYGSAADRGQTFAGKFRADALYTAFL